MNVLEELKKLRRGAGWRKILPQSNPYRVMLEEEDGYSVYSFSCPVYRSEDRRLVDSGWRQEGDTTVCRGSDCRAEIAANRVTLSNEGGSVEIGLPQEAEIELEPTMNGVAVRIYQSAVCVSLHSHAPYAVRENGGCFALMRDAVTPFFCCDGLFAQSGKELIPLELYSRQGSDKDWLLFLRAEGAQSLAFELNLHVPKSIFDTTVESGNPDRNNAFGGVAFLGRSTAFGEQRLFTRFDTMQLLDLNVCLVAGAALYLPLFASSGVEAEAYRIDAPWCSFGSTWATQNDLGEFLAKADVLNDYLKLPVTDIVRTILRLHEPRNPGVAIVGKNPGAAVIATADNYLRPQILEIQLKRN